LDANNDGSVTVEDLAHFLSAQDLAPARLEAISILQKYQLHQASRSGHVRRQSAGGTPPPVAPRQRHPEASPHIPVSVSQPIIHATPPEPVHEPTPEPPKVDYEAPPASPPDDESYAEPPPDDLPAETLKAAPPAEPIAKSSSKTALPSMGSDLHEWLEQVEEDSDDEAEKKPSKVSEAGKDASSEKSKKGGMYKNVDWEKLNAEAEAMKGGRESSDDDEEVGGPRSDDEAEETSDSIGDNSTYDDDDDRLAGVNGTDERN